MSQLQLLGRGWNFPVQPEPRSGGLELTQGPENVRQSIRITLDTEPGERIMRPTFGCGLRRYLMKPNTTATRALIQLDVERALANWEPRIQVQAIDVLPGEDPALVLIHISYVHVRDRREDSLVYPFYLE